MCLRSLSHLIEMIQHMIGCLILRLRPHTTICSRKWHTWTINVRLTVGLIAIVVLVASAVALVAVIKVKVVVEIVLNILPIFVELCTSTITHENKLNWKIGLFFHPKCSTRNIQSKVKIGKQEMHGDSRLFSWNKLRPLFMSILDSLDVVVVP